MTLTEKKVRKIFEGALANNHPYKVVSSQYGHILKELKNMHTTLKEHNDRLTKLERIQERFRGASMATKTIWGIVSVFVIAIVFGMFQMYLTINKLDLTIESKIRTALEGYVLQEVK